MATSDFIAQLMNQAQVRLPGASMAGLNAELFDVFREFFNDSSSWLEDIQFTVLPATLDYLITPTSGQIIRLAGVTDVNKIAQPALMPSINTVSFLVPYNSIQQMTATVIKSVSLPPPDPNNLSDTSDNQPQPPVYPMEVPDWVFLVWGTGILSGLLGNMMTQVNKSYTDKTQGVYHLQRFRDAISRARVSTLRRNTWGAQAWLYPQNFRARTQRGGVSTSNPNMFR